MLILCSCRKNGQSNGLVRKVLNEEKYVVNSEFPIGDVRRYGIVADSLITPKQMEGVLDLAESGIQINFPKGYYRTSLILRGRTNISIFFHDASFSGQIQIMDGLNSLPSQKISLKGKVTTYNKFFTKFSKGITIDTLIIASDTEKNDSNKRPLGCNIYAGTKNLSINKLIIEDLGSGEEYYKFSLAALQIHGWNNNPENVNIREVLIERSDKHGAYITGSNHNFGKITIKKVGLGTVKINNGLEDADASEIDIVASLWINKCQSSYFRDVIIDCKDSKAKVTVNFDEGSSNKTTILDFLTIKHNLYNIPMIPNDLTNVVVRHYKDEY